MLFRLLMTSVVHLHFNMQDEDIIWNTLLWQDLSFVYTLVNLQIIVWHKRASHNNVEHTDAKTLLVSAFECW